MESDYTAGVIAGDLILFDVTMTPPPATAAQIPIEVIDSAQVQLAGSPITVTINPAAGEESSSTRGQIAVPETGVQTPVTLQFANSVRGYTFALGGRSIEVPLEMQTTTPNLTIAGKGAVEEGENAVFTITADQQSNVPVTVEVRGSDLSARTGVNYVTDVIIYETLPANTSSIEISIPTIENTDDEKDGVVEATLVERVGYSLASGLTPGYVDVYDDDGNDPVFISVEADPTSVSVGTNATFTFRRTGATTDKLPFGYKLIETGEVTTETPGNVTNVEFDAGESMEVITVSTVEAMSNSAGEITLRVLPPSEFNSAEYRVKADAARAKVDVTPLVRELTLSVENAQTFLGGEIEYTVSIAPPPRTPVTIPIEAVDANNAAQTVTPTGGVMINPAAGESSSSATGRVSVAGTGTGPITIKLADSVTGYTFNPSGKSEDVPIVAVPSDVQVYIEAPETINEGSDVTITVHISQPPSGSTTSSADLTIELSVADLTDRTADYIDEATLYKVLKSGDTSVTFTIPTKAPTTGLLDGVLVATIVDGIGYAPESGNETAYVEVYDLNSPADILTVAGDASSIIEGQDAVFTITRTGSADKVDFQYNISVSDPNIYGGTLLDIASTIPANLNERKITITTTEHSNPLADNTNIRLTLENTREFVTADYRINQSSATINVTDKIPVVAFKNYPTNVTIGHSFTFTVEADPHPANPLTVGLNLSGITPSGLFASLEDSENNTVTNSVTVPTTGSIEITVRTAAAGTSGDQSSKFFGFSTPAQGAGYSVSTVTTENRATINLLDNSNPSAVRPNIALQTHATETVSLADASELTFNIIATPVPTNDVDVNVLVSELSGNFLSSSTVPPVRLNKTAGQMMTPFTVAIADKNLNTEDGESTITVTLTHGDGYTLVDSTADPNHTTSAKVVDAAPILPELSIANASETLAGKNAQFIVKSKTSYTGNLTLSYTPVKSGGNYLNETDGDGTANNSGPNTNSGLMRTSTLEFKEDNGAYVATLSVATIDDPNDTDGGTITVTLNEDPETDDTYMVSTELNANIGTVMVIKVPVPELTIATSSTTISVNEGTSAMIMVQASENPKQPVTFNYTPTETGTEYLAPVTENGVSKGSGDERSVTMEFRQTGSNPSSSDPWVATISLATQEDVELGGTISVMLGAGTGYTVGTANTSTVTVKDISIPALSIAYIETETLAGMSAMLEVTSSIPFVGSLNVTYRPVKSGGDYLNETDGASGGPNTNSGVDRTIPLTFAKVGDDYTATLSFSTVDDLTDTDGGTITVTLQDDSADPDTYRVLTTAGANTAMVSVIEVPIPVLTITTASTTIDVEEGRTAEIIVEASENPKRELTFNFTPTESETNYLTSLTQDDVNKGSGVERSISLEFTQADSSPGSTDPWLATISLETQGHDAMGGTIVVVLGSGTGYTVGTTDSATITVTEVGVLVPLVSIVLLNDPATISEGQTIRTVLSTELAHPTPTSPIQVSISIDQGGKDYIAYRVPRVVEMTSRIEPLNISTLDDSVQDGAGSIRVTISGDGTTFTIDNSYIEVDVSEDNDENAVEETRISVAEAAVTSILALNQFAVNSPSLESSPAIELPKVSVAAVTPIVDEGAPARFNISGSGNLNDDVVVGYTLTPEGDFFENLGQGSHWVRLSVGQPNLLVEINTIDDTAAERDGSLTLTLLDGRTYDLTDQSSCKSHHF